MAIECWNENIYYIAIVELVPQGYEFHAYCFLAFPKKHQTTILNRLYGAFAFVALILLIYAYKMPEALK